MKKIKINYINTRLLSGFLGFTLLTTFLAGCSNNNFKYKNGENGNISIEGSIKYNNMNDYCLLKVKNLKTGDDEIYIAQKTNWYLLALGKSKTVYTNIFNNIDIIAIDSDGSTTDNSDIFEYVEETSLDYYLITYNMQKFEYTIEDFEKLLERIKEDYYPEDTVKVRERTNDNS